MEKRGVYAIIVNGRTGDVLLARRSALVNNPGMWNLPGGRLDPGEKYMAALRRELSEELGWRLTRNQSSQWHRITYQGLDPTRVYVLIEMDEPPAVKLNEEHDKYIWVKPALLRLFKTNPPTKHFLSTVNVLEVISHDPSN